MLGVVSCGVFVFFQAEDGIRDLVRSRGLGDVYKRQLPADNLKFVDAGLMKFGAVEIFPVPGGSGSVQQLSLIHI